MSKELTEIEVLKALNIPDFRHMSKDKIITFASIIHEMNPQVAKKALDQCPAFFQMALGALKESMSVAKKSMDSNDKSHTMCMEIYNKASNIIENCIQNQGITFEEKKYYIEQVYVLIQKAQKKDSENKHFNWKTVATIASAVAFVAGVGGAILGANGKIKLPDNTP